MTESALAALAVLVSLARVQASPDQPTALFDAVAEAAEVLVGHRLFTILAYDEGARESQRIYTSRPESYPVGGRKPVTDSPWMQQVVQRGEPWIGRHAGDIRDAFFDHQLIRALGCASALNVAVRWRGRTLATLNLLHEENWYRPEHADRVQLLASFVLPALIERRCL